MRTGPHQKNVMQYTWCYAHILKLVINDVKQCATQVEPFFGLLEKKQLSFLYKRFPVWTEQACSRGHGHEKLPRLKENR